jgi:S1-C subfamily serine protease
MKRKIALLALCLSMFAGGAALATVNGTYQGRPIVKLSSNGVQLKAQDVPAQILDDRTVVPLYMLRDAGFEVTWDGSTYGVDVKHIEPLSDAQTAEIKRHVGHISVTNSDGTTSQGTGFMIANDVFVTAHHVVEENGKVGKVTVKLNGSTYTPTDMFYSNPQRDVAAFRLKAGLPGLKVQTTKWLDGQFVRAVGYPLGEWKVSEGITTATDEGATSNAKVDHGSSGGPLLNSKSEVIGVNVFMSAGDQTAATIPLSQLLNNLK